jgi:ubiquitin conjugation factor E4 B
MGELTRLARRQSPESLDLSGKNELVIFALTFLTSTWYIKNPFLKAKVNEVRLLSCHLL